MFRLRNPSRVLKDIQNLFARFLQYLERHFQKWGSITYKRPMFVLLGNLIVLLALVYGYFLYELETDLQKLWVPQNSEAVHDQKKLQELYTSESRPEIVYAVSKSRANLLTAAAFEELTDFDIAFRLTVQADGKHFEDLCYTYESRCETYNHPLQFFENPDGSYDRSYYASTASLLSKINSGKGHMSQYPLDSDLYIRINTMFGGTTPENVKTDHSTGTNDIQEAVAVSWTYFLAQNLHDEAFFQKYEASFEEFAQKFNENSKHVNLYLMTASGINRESDTAFSEDLQLIFIGIALIVIYSVVVLFSPNVHQSRMLISLIGVLNAFISYFEAISFCSYFGIKGNAVVSLVPFMLLGIGVDDMYVLVGALNAAPAHYSSKRKFKYMARSAGVSVTITSFTNICAFAIGSITKLEAIRVFCFYAAVGMFFDYFNQVTFFVAAIALDLRRSDNQRGDCCGLVFCNPQSKVCCNGKLMFKPDGTSRDSLGSVVFGDFYARCLMNKTVRYLVSLVFIALAVFNIYQLSFLEFEFTYEWFIQDSFYIKNAIDIRDEYFANVGQTLRVVSHETSFSPESVQLQLRTLEEKLSSCEECRENWIIEDSTDSWYKVFNNWVGRGQCVVDNQEITRTAEGLIPSMYFDECFDQWMVSGEGSLYRSRFVYEDKVLRSAYIKAGLIFFQETQRSVQAMNDIRAIAKVGPTRTFAYNELFPWYEHYASFVDETSIQMASTVAMIFCVIIVVLAHCLHAFTVLVMVSFTIFGQLALLQVWGEHLNTITMVNSVIGIGIAVDYCAHFTYTYAKNRDLNMESTHKVIKAFKVVGSNVFSGGLSTFLVILPLVFSQTYVFKTFFKCWFGIVLYGMFHSLVVLPVILSISRSRVYRKRETRATNITVLPVSPEFQEIFTPSKDLDESEKCIDEHDENEVKEIDRDQNLP